MRPRFTLFDKSRLQALLVGSSTKKSTTTATASTIFAVSSGRPPSAIAVIRISGSKAGLCLSKMTGRNDSIPSKLFFTPIIDPRTGEILDRAMAVWMPGPKTFTGEDCAELHVHGGPAVIESVISSLGSLSADCRMAAPGEFTKRAFFNGKMDLTAIEGLSDLLRAETPSQRRLALVQAGGELRRFYEQLRAELITASAHCEAYLDFGEDDNIGDTTLANVRTTVDGLRRRLQMHLSDGRRGERLRDGVRVAVVGRPNAGKSSLVNWLCRRPLAIVSPIAGTTRDSLDTHVNLAGHPVVVTDTAGLRHSLDPIEQEGVRRTRSRMKTADVLVVIVDAAQLVGSNARDEVVGVLQESGMFEDDVADVRVVAVVNKIDTNPVPEQHSITLPSGEKIPLVAVSCKTEQGLSAFLSTLTQLASFMCSVNEDSASPTFSRVRQRKLVEEALNELHDFEPLLGVDITVAAQKLRNATHAIGMIVGSVCTEELLDAIFRDFCIGK